MSNPRPRFGGLQSFARAPLAPLRPTGTGPGLVSNSFTVTVRFNRDAPSMDYGVICRAALRLGVHPSSYMRARAIECAKADLEGARSIQLGRLQLDGP